MQKQELVVILDFGGQYNQLIARRVRECNVYCEIKPYTTPLEEIKALHPKGIIFTGGPNSVFDMSSPHYTKEILEIGVPILGICYGCQLIAWMGDGEVKTAPVSEYGKIELQVTDPASALFRDVPETSIVWMSHTDYIATPPEGYQIVGKTNDCPCAAMQNTEKKIYAVQFHPEVTHSEYGKQILRNFLYEVCACSGDWVIDNFIENTVAALREKIGDKKVILGLSGGVDSSVAAGLLSRAVGKQLTCVFVDQGLMRKDEGDFVEQTFTTMFDMNFVRVNCGELFMSKLKGVTDPEEKRKIIGTEFYKVFWNEIRGQAEDGFFAQGSIYPDRIESGKGKSDGKANTAVIKTHHNMAKMPDDIQFLGVIEPLGDLFKDEVRQVGRELGLPEYLVSRQPFPGPGLGIRIIGEVTPEKVAIVQDADAIWREEIAKAGLDKEINQYYAALTNMRSVGVMGDERTYDYAVALRAVTTTDFMTAESYNMPWDVLGTVTSRIVNEVKHVNRVFYDCTGKPPATIELE